MVTHLLSPSLRQTCRIRGWWWWRCTENCNISSNWSSASLFKSWVTEWSWKSSWWPTQPTAFTSTGLGETLVLKISWWFIASTKVQSTWSMICILFSSSLYLRLMTVWDVASDTVHNQVIKHDFHTGIFNRSYINHTVRFNMQNIFLKSNISDDELIQIFTYMSICCNSDALKEVPNKVMGSLLAVDSDVVELKQQFKTLHIMLKCKYKFIKQISKKKLTEYKDLYK